MSEPAQTPMTFETFLEWAAQQPDRHELVRGTPVAMAPERAAHVRMKARVHRALDDAIRAKDLSCEAFIDGMTVQIDDETAYEPDVVVHCGPPVPGDAVVVSHPVIVVEVLSPSTRGRDAGSKLADYFRVPTIVHYLLVHTDRSTVIHHARRSDADRAGRRSADDQAATITSNERCRPVLCRPPQTREYHRVGLWAGVGVSGLRIAATGSAVALAS